MTCAPSTLIVIRALGIAQISKLTDSRGHVCLLQRFIPFTILSIISQTYHGRKQLTMRVRDIRGMLTYRHRGNYNLIITLTLIPYTLMIESKESTLKGLV
jgi:hypothetical protein